MKINHFGNLADMEYIYRHRGYNCKLVYLNQLIKSYMKNFLLGGYKNNIFDKEKYGKKSSKVCSFK